MFIKTSVTTTMMNKEKQKLVIRTCSIPDVKATEIYHALNYKTAPFFRLKSVLPEL